MFAPRPLAGRPLAVLRLLLPMGAAPRGMLKQHVLRILIATNLLLGGSYLLWRYRYSINWAAWPITPGGEYCWRLTKHL